MFIRLKTNKGGSTSVQLLQSVRMNEHKHPRLQVVKNFGSATAPDEIEALKQQAVIYRDLSTLLQSSASNNGELLIQSGSDIKHCGSIITGFSEVFGSLYQTIFYGLGLQKRGNQMLCDLTIMRIAQPKSKRFTANIAAEYGIELSVDSIYKFMDRITPGVLENIKLAAFKNTKNLLKQDGEALEVLFYDLTSLHFETNCQDALRDFGFSKDGKSHHVQIMMALITTKHGLPVGYEIFKGNTYEGNTLLPTIEALKEKYTIEKITVVADSGLMTQANMEGLKKMGLQYILGGRIKNSSRTLIHEALEPQDYQPLTKGIQAKTYKDAVLENQDARTIIYHSEDRANKDAYDRQKSLEKIMKNIGKKVKSKLSGVYKHRYVKLSTDSVIEIDYDKLTESAKLDGFFSLETNIMDGDMLTIMNHYRGLWQIEQTFRIAKYNLKTRPVFHYNIDRIKAHFAICYTALTLIRTLEYKTRKHEDYMPLEELNESLRKVRIVNLEIKEKSFSISQDFPEKLLNIYKALRIKLPKRFSTV